MREFYKQPDVKLLRRRSESPEAWAKSYAKWWHLNDVKDHLGTSHYSFGVTTSDGDLEWMTRRCLALADSVVFTHGGHGQYHEARPRETLDSFDGPAGNPTESVTPGGGPTLPELGLVAPNIVDLGTWIRDSRAIARKGLVAYLPVTARVRPDGTLAYEQPPTILDLLTDGHEITHDTEKEVAAEAVQKICQLNIPALEHGSFKQFSELIANEPATYDPFRNLIRTTLLKLGSPEVPALSNRDKVEFEETLKKGLRDTASQVTDGKWLKRTELSLYTGAASLYAVPVNLLPSFASQALSTLASGGILVQGLTKRRDVLKNRRDLRASGWYFLWRLERLEAPRPTRTLRR
ncbi:hypothetical protein [Streptomyces sp. NPDC055140]